MTQDFHLDFLSEMQRLLALPLSDRAQYFFLLLQLGSTIAFVIIAVVAACS